MGKSLIDGYSKEKSPLAGQGEETSNYNLGLLSLKCAALRGREAGDYALLGFPHTGGALSIANTTHHTPLHFLGYLPSLNWAPVRFIGALLWSPFDSFRGRHGDSAGAPAGLQALGTPTSPGRRATKYGTLGKSSKRGGGGVLQSRDSPCTKDS